MTSIKYIPLFFLSIIIFFSCRKDSFIKSSDARLQVSADTLSFDTVFTSRGSVTGSLKIYNLNDQKLLISKVKLVGGPSSSFKINVDGVAASEVDHLEIAANDSLYIFVQVNIDPSAVNMPFIIRDSILISYNNNERFIQLQAYGQNANFLKNTKVTGNVTWTNDLPYVILGGLEIDTTASLTIQQGTRIYLHADAPIIVNGSLHTNGTLQNKVIFTGDRLDPDYRDLPASWPGIYFMPPSKDNTLRFTVVKNAFQGLVAQEPSINSNPKLKVSQCIIDNIYDAGILGIHSAINADNTLITNCGSNIILGLGGVYQFTHCTVASYSNIFITHKNPVLQVSNYALQNNQTFTENLDASFTNCIFWGEGGIVEDEVVVAKEGTKPFNVLFDHDLYKVTHDPNAILNQVIKNADPLFDSINVDKQYFDFHFNNNPGSPAVDAGILTLFPKDLDDTPRVNGLLPDLGSYER
ncbi:MAG: hypothetical protein ABJA57_01505 [Ginsengibacter sp.]